APAGRSPPPPSARRPLPCPGPPSRDPIRPPPSPLGRPAAAETGVRKAALVLVSAITASGGRNRKAAFGILTAFCRSATTIETLAVIPGSSFKSALLTSTTQS